MDIFAFIFTMIVCLGSICFMVYSGTKKKLYSTIYYGVATICSFISLLLLALK